MNNELKCRMENLGIDVSGGIERFMGNEALFEKFFRRFGDDKSYGELVDAVSAGDAERAFAAAHTLKGVCGNLSMVRLEQLVSRQVEYLRNGDLSSAADLMSRITAIYSDMIKIIRES